MLIDYLRYQAFSGRLKNFFEEDIRNYVDLDQSTGQHLSFSTKWINSKLRVFDHYLDKSQYYRNIYRDFDMDYFLEELGITVDTDISPRGKIILGERPPTYYYMDDLRSHLQIIIDINPNDWSEKYIEPRSYEGVPITFRSSSAARANLATGSRIVDKFHKQSGYGTLCGLFEAEDGLTFGLTCGHVTRSRGDVLVEHPRRFWNFNFGSSYTPLGSTRYRTLCGPDVKTGDITTQLDAALIDCNNCAEHIHSKSLERKTRIKPISSVLQEEPVKFRGASRNGMTFARISAVTVRKSIDLFGDGNLHSIGDALMLGHRERMYIVQPVSRPGDSGSAVRSNLPENAPPEHINQWYGMVLGGDEHSAYASHAECIWAWAADTLSTSKLDFYF